MPYIEKQYREKLDRLLEPLLKEIDSPIYSLGLAKETYVIYKILVRLHGQGNWLNRSDAFRTMMSALTEFERRKLAPYEDTKIVENGDVE